MNEQPGLRNIAHEVALLPNPTTSPGSPRGTIFETLADVYGTLASRAHDMVIHQITGEAEQGLRPHFAALNS